MPAEASARHTAIAIIRGTPRVIATGYPKDGIIAGGVAFETPSDRGEATIDGPLFVIRETGFVR